MNTKIPYYIAIDGIDGCGKSTIAKALLAQTNGKTKLLKEPSKDRPWGRIIYSD